MADLIDRSIDRLIDRLIERFFRRKLTWIFFPASVDNHCIKQRGSSRRNALARNKNMLQHSPLQPGRRNRADRQRQSRADDQPYSITHGGTAWSTPVFSPPDFFSRCKIFCSDFSQGTSMHPESLRGRSVSKLSEQDSERSTGERVDSPVAAANGDIDAEVVDLVESIVKNVVRGTIWTLLNTFFFTRNFQQFGKGFFWAVANENFFRYFFSTFFFFSFFYSHFL